MPAPSIDRVRASIVVEDDCPVVLPTAYIPSDWLVCATVLTPEIVIVPEAPFRLWLRVMLLPPASTKRSWPPEAMPVVPLVFPTFDMPNDCDSTVWVGAEIRSEPAE